MRQTSNVAFCEPCATRVSASHLVRDGKVYLCKECPKCGRPVEAVYVLRGAAACRRCHRLLYRSQCHRSASAYRVLGRLLAANGREDVNEPLLRGLVDALRAVMVREPVRMSLAEKGGGDAAE